MIINERLETVSLSKLRPHPENPRTGDVNAIWESITETGFYGALVVQKSTGYILAGNHRYFAAQEAGYDALPVFWLDVDDERAMRILLADNRTNDLATYDARSLAQLLEHLASTDDGLSGTAYGGADLDRLLGELSAPTLPAGEAPLPGGDGAALPFEAPPLVDGFATASHDETERFPAAGVTLSFGEYRRKFSREVYEAWRDEVRAAVGFEPDVIIAHIMERLGLPLDAEDLTAYDPNRPHRRQHG